MTNTDDLTVTVDELLEGYEVTDSRRELLDVACAAGATRTALEAIRDAIRVSSGPLITLPAHHFEGLSRGRGWARKGRGESVVWGDRVDGGYRVGPGNWTVGASDGFRRKKSVTWAVLHVDVGDLRVWTVAS